MAKVALLGTGRMGTELGKHLLAAGHQLTVWNRSPNGTAELVAAGANAIAGAKAAVAGQDIVITCLFGPDSVDNVVVAPNLLPKDALWLDITTVGPDDAARYARWADENGVRYVHGPVLGSLGPARARQLGVYLGGAASDVAAAKPFAALWAAQERLITVQTQRAAAVGKLLANLALGVALEGVAEALRFGKTQDLSSAEVVTMLKGTFLAAIADAKGSIITGEKYADTQFSVDLLAKDARLMLTAAGDDLGEDRFPALEGLLANLDEAKRRGFGDYDIAAVAMPVL